MHKIIVLVFIFFGFNAQAGFFDDLGKDLSMLSCKSPAKKKLIESVILNRDPSKPQIWSWKVTHKGQLIVDKNGDAVPNPDPRQWYTIYAKDSLKYFCWEARLSHYVSTRRLQMYPAVKTNYVCGHKVYSCMTGTEGGDNDNHNAPAPGDSDNGGDNPGDSDDGGQGPGDSDDGDQGPGDSDDGGQGPGNSDDNF